MKRLCAHLSLSSSSSNSGGAAVLPVIGSTFQPQTRWISADVSSSRTSYCISSVDVLACTTGTDTDPGTNTPNRMTWKLARQKLSQVRYAPQESMPVQCHRKRAFRSLKKMLNGPCWDAGYTTAQCLERSWPIVKVSGSSSGSASQIFLRPFPFSIP